MVRVGRAGEGRGGRGGEKGAGWCRAQLQKEQSGRCAGEGGGAAMGKGGGVDLGLRTHKGVFSRWPSRPDAGRGPGAGTSRRGGAGRALPSTYSRRREKQQRPVRGRAAAPRGKDTLAPPPAGPRAARVPGVAGPQLSSGPGGPGEARGGRAGQCVGRRGSGEWAQLLCESRASAPAPPPPGGALALCPGGALHPRRPGVLRAPR